MYDEKGVLNMLWNPDILSEKCCHFNKLFFDSSQVHKSFDFMERVPYNLHKFWVLHKKPKNHCSSQSLRNKFLRRALFRKLILGFATSRTVFSSNYFRIFVFIGLILNVVLICDLRSLKSPIAWLDHTFQSRISWPA